MTGRAAAAVVEVGAEDVRCRGKGLSRREARGGQKHGCDEKNAFHFWYSLLGHIPVAWVNREVGLFDVDFGSSFLQNSCKSDAVAARWCF